ncbi:FAD-binding oxidoreductase [Cytobacillus dafuensis]|uniref:FAD-binding oxidoreductase n=1 Tax=Cytobacillus dafuensis TaxID=1742359 RepID=A0A5B8Z428_CYTDA|nr:FAD-binding oxidoreductase [Cytobacillus dafuensis]QED47043.1 FAD-binding oxidoreductase [Cytobacillus dafuensis]
MNQSISRKLLHFLNEDQVITDSSSLERLSKDYYWYSPVLKEMLDNKIADCIAVPENENDMINILLMAVKERIPVTVRGAGTGNYGQIIPINGGILMDISRMNRIIEINDGSVKVQPGVKLGLLERKLRDENQELCIYPSTYMKSTASGFVCGGSGGIGSITWGNLWDGNVLGIRIITMEDSPRVIQIEGEELINYIHSYGTTGIISEIVFRITEKIEWQQIIVSFEDLEKSLRFAKAVCETHQFKKRSVSTCEWPIPSFFKPLEKMIKAEKHIVILEIEESYFEELKEIINQYEGEVTYTIPSEQYHKGISLSDFTWNHTTLWALKSNEKMTYLQCSFNLNHYLDQIKLIKNRFGDEFYIHFDWFRSKGELIPQAIPLVRFSSKKRLDEMIEFCESIGVKIFNPHTPLLEEGGWEEHIDSVLKIKRENDPYSLLNPGKIGVLLDI